MSTSTTTINVNAQKATVAALLTALVNGINTDLAGIDPIVLDGTSYVRADLLGRIQACLSAIVTVKTARTALLQAVANQRAATVQALALRASVKRLLLTKFGPQSPKLQDFGFTPTRVAQTPVATKAEAKVKSAATRVARGTKGKKQKAQIKGTLPPTTSSDAVTAASPAPQAPAKPVTTTS